MPAKTRLDPLAVVEEKVAQGERLSAVDGTTLFESSDLLRIGRLADRARRRKVGDDVYFVVNRHINYTNICRNRCRFCAFSRDEGEPGAYSLTVDEVLAKAQEAIGEGATEIHIVGGEHPALPYASVRAMVSGIRDLGRSVHIKAFTASEIEHFAETEGLSAEYVLRDLQVGWSGQPARRRGGDLRGAGPRTGMPGEDIGRTMAGGAPARAQPGVEDQRDHALRPR